RAGCYAIHFVAEWPEDYPPDHVINYEGTFRIEHLDGEGQTLAFDAGKDGSFGEYLRASGDLYATPQKEFPSVPQDIPIYPRDDYRFYLWVTGLEEDKADGFTLRCESHSFENYRWKAEGEFTVKMKWTEPPGNVPS